MKKRGDRHLRKQKIGRVGGAPATAVRKRPADEVRLLVVAEVCNDPACLHSHS